MSIAPCALRKILGAAFLFSLPALLAGCAPDARELWGRLADQAGPHGFRPKDFSAPPFHLAGLMKGAAKLSDELVVYLEGDGRAVVRGRIMSDPSPYRAQACELALRDPAPNVLYLARIGQYRPDQQGPNFQSYWGRKRLSDESVQAAGAAIDQAKRELGAKKICLIGYSGGGGLAVLLAERRNDVSALVTVAGLLDTAWWVREKNFPPGSLDGSLNPADQSRRLIDLPQLHVYATDDIITGPEMPFRFKASAPFKHLATLAVKGDHWNPWTDNWPDILKRYVIPMRESAR